MYITYNIGIMGMFEIKYIVCKFLLCVFCFCREGFLFKLNNSKNFGLAKPVVPLGLGWQPNKQTSVPFSQAVQSRVRVHYS